jgi:zinc transport system substrate-binding protein
VDDLLGAGVVLYLGRGFQPAVEQAVKQRHDGVTVDVLEAVGGQLRTLSGGETLRGGLDPHVWLDPVLYRAIVQRVRDALAQADPAGKATYAANADADERRLDELDHDYRARLASCQRHTIVTSHAAFGYLSARYGLAQVPITGIDPEAEPDPKRLADLTALVRRQGVTTIFTETLVSPRVAEALAREAGVRTAVLDPLEGLTPAEIAKGDSYDSVMRRNLAILRSALGCR